MAQATTPTRTPWSWVPSLYMAEGLPFTMVMSVSVIMYKRLGIPNAEIAFWTSILYLPWVVKPLWSPVVDMIRTKRFWIVSMQFLLGILFAGIAFVLPLPGFFQFSLAIFALMAFSSATHDIAADGFYMLALPEHQQAAFVGARSTFYRIAMISGQGGIVIVAGLLEKHYSVSWAWSAAFIVISAVFFLFFLYHKFMLPVPASDVPVISERSRGMLGEFFSTFGSFFNRKGIGVILAFLFLFRLNESQLTKLISPFLLDARVNGGLGLTTEQVGLAYGTIGLAMLLTGGILGGLAISRKGLKFWLLPMVLLIHLPDLMYVLLSRLRPDSFALVCCAVGTEQLAYGFSFTAYMMFMIMVSEGAHKTAHYAICTGLMALGMMLPGMVSGALQQWLGYQNFFLAVSGTTLVGLIIALVARVEPEFGKKK
jgi:MFS transporter, PAT family, beta-lactamase induction signal transducer AmpG